MSYIAAFLRNAALTAYVTQMGAGAFIELWNGTIPTQGATPAGTKLATLTLGSDILAANGGAAGGVSAGALTFGGWTQNSANHVAGTPTFFRLKKADNTFGVDIPIGSGAGTIGFTGAVATGTNITPNPSVIWTAGNNT